jgi:hypothetical protein
MTLHKYNIKGITVYRVSEEMSKPSGSITVTPKDWVGRVYGGNSQTAISQLMKSDTTREEKEPKEEIEKKPGMKACMSKILRDFISTIKE